MKRVLVAVVFTILGAAGTAFTPGTDQNIMNATSRPVSLDIHCSASKDIEHFGLAPGQSVGCDGVLLRLRFRTASGKTLTLDEQQLRRLHSGTVPKEGGWLIEDSGVRSVSSRDYMLAYRRFHKLWP